MRWRGRRWRDDNHADLRDVSNAQERVINDADRLRALHIPAGAIWLDRPYGTGQMGWGNMDFDSSFPDPPKMISDLNDRGIALLLWIANRCWNMLYQEGSAKGYLFGGPGSAADLQRPEAYEWFKEKLNAYFRLGVKGYKIDRGEEGELPRSVENLNAILFPKLAAEGLEQFHDRDYLEFSRNAMMLPDNTLRSGTVTRSPPLADWPFRSRTRSAAGSSISRCGAPIRGVILAFHRRSYLPAGSNSAPTLR